MALEGLLSSVRAQVHVEVGFLCEGVVAELTHVGPLVPVGRKTSPSPLPPPASAPWLSAQHLWEEGDFQPTPPGLWGRDCSQESQGDIREDTGHTVPVLGLDVHLEAIAARGPVPTLLTHKQLLPTVLEGLMQAQLCPGQKALGAG